MSTRELSMTSSASKTGVSRKVRKFAFRDLALSYQVRKRLYELLISFDDNVNYEFEKDQIRKALVQILQQSEHELAYVLNNVFRYDTNRDGIVTYEQFSNFCLEQHFGEMAIQRMHKVGTYSRGKERLMSKAEFIKTVEYCLSFISIKPPQPVLENIFMDVDTDQDGFITYVEYFTFLKEYFGSQSESATVVTVTKVEEDLKKQYGDADRNTIKQDIFKDKLLKVDRNNQNKPKTKTQHFEKKPAQPTVVVQPVKPIVLIPAQTSNSVNSLLKSQQIVDLSQRISRLIYQQVRITAIDQDRNMVLGTEEKGAQQLLFTTLKLSQARARKIINENYEKETKVSYQKILKCAIEKTMTEQAVDSCSYPLNKAKFVQSIHQNLHFVRAKPFSFLLEELYDKLIAFYNKTELQKPEFKQVMELVFISYKWPRQTGELRKKDPLIPKIVNNRIVGY